MKSLIMNNSQLFRALVNSQSTMKSELLSEIKKVDKKVELVRDDLVKIEKNLTERIDKIGLQVARLEDDTPTIEDFNDVSSKVDQLQQNFLTV